MKKLLLLLALSLMLNGCKQKDAAPQTGTKTQPLMDANATDCTFFDPLRSMDAAEKVNWLRTNQTEACLPKYDKCREMAHEISQEEYNSGVNAYWNERKPIYTNYDLSYIKGLATTTEYEKFVVTSASGNKVMLSAGTQFTEDPSCFAMPLFYSLERLYTLDPHQEFIFTWAIIDTHQTVVFQIAGTNHFYDFSQNPM